MLRPKALGGSLPLKTLRSFLLACLVGAATPCVAQSESEWFEVRTPHFVVISDAGRSKAWTVADEFERIRRVFNSAMDPSSSEPDTPLVIFAVKTEAGFRELLPGLGEFLPVGAFREARDGYRVVLRLDATGENRFQTVYHEYHHLLLRERVADAPSWLVEGLAEFWSQAVIGLDVVELGNPHRGHLRFLQNERMMPLVELLSITGFRHDAPPAAIRMLYAQSWALTHWLMFADGTGTGQEKLERYLELVAGGSESVAAFEEVFGPVDEVEPQVRQYVRQSMFPAMRIDTPDEPTDRFEVRALSGAESAELRSEFLLAGDQPAAARRVLEDASAASPEAVGAEKLGILAFESYELDRAAEQFARAVDNGSATHLSHYYLALVAKERGDAEATGVELERAVALAPDFAPALMELAAHLSRKPEQRERVESLAGRALALAPDDRFTLVQLARTFLEMGRPGEARNVLDRLRALPAEPGSKAILRALEEDIARHESLHR